MRIVPYSEDLEFQVKDFNRRLREGGEGHYRFPESHFPKFPRVEDRKLYQEFFLLLHDSGVHGGYFLTHSEFAIEGEMVAVACGPQMNLSEGIVKREYGMVGVIQAQDALRKQPLMYALGMGSVDERQPRMLQAIGWTLHTIPFRFRVVHPGKFLANITYLRRSPRWRYLLDALRFTGAGYPVLHGAQLRMPQKVSGLGWTTCDQFDTWADTIWESCKTRYSFIALRDRATLNVLYPASETRFHKLLVRKQSVTVGWAVMLDTQMNAHKQFGNMRVGSIVDCLAAPEDAQAVVRAATRFLESREVDIIVTNQANDAWCSALLHEGYLSGPSNFILGLSEKLAEKLQPFDVTRHRIHMNRGDGDGPIHL